MELESVEAVTHNGRYGNVRNASPNHMYKKYVAWMGDKGGKPLSFKEWLQWAQKKGLAQERVLSADGNNTEVVLSEDDVKKSLKKIGVFILFASIAVIGITLIAKKI